jgi:hypothetical protein
MKKGNYNDQVFINCPFDNDYLAIFRACIFTVLDAGFIPRCSLEIDDGTQFRLSAIISLINDCRYGIHDLSRVQLDPVSKLPRFNMPFELGLFYSAKHFGTENQKKKQCLVFETEKYRYQSFISDIAGIDIKPHHNSPEKLILELRNWLVTASRRRTIPPGERINSRYIAFKSYIEKTCKKELIDYNAMPFVELVQNMTQWLKINQLIYVPLITP